MTTNPHNARLQPFGVSIFSEMSRLAIEHDAINLSQGFPDFDGPESIKRAAERAIREGKNQYVPSHGTAALREALAADAASRYGHDYDADREITVFAGATEAIASSILALVAPGDEVVCLEPYYDSYAPCITMAGGTPRYVALEFPDFALDEAALDAACSDRTRMIVLNTPQNPTGKVFTRAELETIARIATKYDALVLADEVYEHLVFDDHEHVPIASLDGMRERTVRISSTAKTFSLTGWKVGFAYADAPLTDAIRLSHQYVTFCTPAPFQLAMAEAIGSLDTFAPELRADYLPRRDALMSILGDAGFRLGPPPAGSYFVLADFSPFGFDDDLEFCTFLAREIGVAAVPPSFFYDERRGGRHLARFAFCKSLEALGAAGERLGKLKQHARVSSS